MWPIAWRSTGERVVGAGLGAAAREAGLIGLVGAQPRVAEEADAVEADLDRPLRPAEAGEDHQPGGSCFTGACVRAVAVDAAAQPTPALVTEMTAETANASVVPRTGTACVARPPSGVEKPLAALQEGTDAAD